MHPIFKSCITSLFLLPIFSQAQVLPVREISLNEALQLVLLNNFEVASSKLGLESAREQFAGEKGALWEPSLIGGVNWVSNRRENNTEEFIRQGVEDFSEDNTLYNAGLEQPLPTGGALQISYNVDYLNNNLQEQRNLDFQEKQYDSFAGVTLTQPLLKNAGTAMGLSLMRMAREESEVAFQQYRRQLMQSLGQTEAAYWELRISQERVGMREKSVKVAEKILEDNRARVKNGKMPKLEVQEAEAGVATRQSQLLEAKQKLDEVSVRLLGYFSLPESEPTVSLRATDSPDLTTPPEIDAAALREASLKLHPDVLISEHKSNQDELRFNYAKNQVLPQLDVKASYGYNGLGVDQSDAYDSATSGDFPSWTVGLQLRVPLGGGQRQRAARSAAEIRLAQGQLSESSVRQQIVQGLHTSISRVKNYYLQAQNFKQVSEMNEAILDTELKRLEAGRSDSRKVLDAEEKLTQAREAQAASLTRLAVAKVEMNLSSGTLLRQLNVDPMVDESAVDAFVGNSSTDRVSRPQIDRKSAAESETVSEATLEGLFDKIQAKKPAAEAEAVPSDEGGE